MNLTSQFCHIRLTCSTCTSFQKRSREKVTTQFGCFIHTNLWFHLNLKRCLTQRLLQHCNAKHEKTIELGWVLLTNLTSGLVSSSALDSALDKDKIFLVILYFINQRHTQSLVFLRLCFLKGLRWCDCSSGQVRPILVIFTKHISQHFFFFFLSSVYSFESRSKNVNIVRSKQIQWWKHASLWTSAMPKKTDHEIRHFYHNIMSALCLSM